MSNKEIVVYFNSVKILRIECKYGETVTKKNNVKKARERERERERERMKFKLRALIGLKTLKFYIIYYFIIWRLIFVHKTL